MKYDVLKYIITTLIGAVIAGGIAYLKTLRDKLKTAKTDNENLSQAVKMLLRADLKRQCRYYIRHEKISIDEFEELTEELKVYEAMDGDGTVHVLYDTVTEIIKNDKGADKK